MTQRREYFRIRCFARIGLRVLAPEEEPAARARIRGRYVPRALVPGTLEESGLPGDQRLLLDLLRHIALNLDRIERRIDDLARRANGVGSDLLASDAPVEICLSASGFAGPFSLELSDKELVEVQLDLGDSGLPMISALARVVQPGGEEPVDDTAFTFEELLPDDRERLVQLVLRSQTLALRDERSGELA
jgi:hypothetical protein